MLFFLLPYVEQSSVYDLFTTDYQVGADLHDNFYCNGCPGPQQQTDAGSVRRWQAAQTVINSFLCPSAPGDKPVLAYMDKVYIVDDSSFVFGSAGQISDANLGLTHYAGVTGVEGTAGNNTTVSDRPSLLNKSLIGRNILGDLIGPFGSRTETKLAKVIDGTSKTFMFGEAIGAVGNSITHAFPNMPNDPSDGFVLGHAWAGWACLPTYNGLDSSIENGTPTAGARYDAHWKSFGSAHSGSIVQFTMVDGSVHTVNRDIDIAIYHAVSTMKGEETASLP